MTRDSGTKPDVLRAVRHLALDMDGTLYRGRTLFPFTVPFLDRIRDLGIGCTFLTNNASKSVSDYVRHLRGFGIAADASQIHTSGLATMDHLRRTSPGVRRLYVLGTPSLREELTGAGFTVVGEDDEPDGVLVSFDTSLTFDRFCRAAWWIRRGKPYVATHPDRVCPTDQPTVLVDCGSILACLEQATGRAPDAVPGKPDPGMLSGILERHGLAPRELAMVGDRLYTDMAMARRAGAVGVLVLTGEATAAEAAAYPEQPEFILPSVRELGELLINEKKGAR